MKSRRKAELSRALMLEVTDERGSVTDIAGPITWRDGKAVLKDYRIGGAVEADACWTPKLVRKELEAAMRLIQRTAGRVGPAAYRSSMPAYSHDWWEQVIQAGEGNLYAGGNRIRLGASAAQVSRMERVMRWQIVYLDAWPGPRTGLRLHLQHVAHGVPFSRLCRERGVPLATAKRARDKALSLISQGLDRDGVIL